MSTAKCLENETLLRNFYEAFARGDAPVMAASYHDEATFSDAVFRNLDASQVRAMWRMLNAQGKDLRVEFSQLKADAERGSVHWEAYYTFSPTGKKVHNSIDARFEFRDGLIFKHVDTFSFWRWSKQALGLPGLALGWNPLLRSIVRQQAAKGLAQWQAKEDAAR